MTDRPYRPYTEWVVRRHFRETYRPELTEEQKVGLWAACAPIIADPEAFTGPPEEETHDR